MVDAGALLNVLSGGTLLFLGLALVLLDARLRVNRALGLFASVWGVQIVGANLPVLVASEQLARAGSALSIPFLLLVAPLFALAAEAVHGGRDRQLAGARWLALGASAAGALLLFLDPDRLLGDVVTPYRGTWRAQWGPAVTLVHSVPFTFVFIAAIVALDRARRAARAGVVRGRLTVFLAALLMYGAYRFPDSVLGFLAAGLETGFRLRWVLEIAAGLAGCALFLAFVARLARERADLLDADERRITGALLVAGLVPFAAAIAAFAAVPFGGPEVVTLGAFRLGMVALLAWGAVRYQLLGADLGARRLSPVVGAALGPFVVVPLVSELASLSSPVIIGLVAAAVAVPCAFAGRALTSGLSGRGEPGRALYYAALASGDNETALARVRERLHVSNDEHARLSRAREHAQDRIRLEPGDHVFGAYRIDRALGSAAHGPTLLAHDILLDRPVVLKPLGELPTDPAARERVLREGRIAARLRHPRVIEVYKVERDGDHLFLVTEFAPGGDLGALLKREASLPTARASALVVDMLDALAAVHAEGVVHRDVTPGNVYLDAHGRAKLGDFGLTMAEGAGDRAGTLLTASPEQLTGGDVTAASDLYAAGALLYALLAGRCYVPLEGRPLPQAIALVTGSPPMLPLPRAGAALNEVLAKALEKDPRRRYASAAEMREALVAAAGPRGAAPAPVAA